MAFPATLLNITVEVALGADPTDPSTWSWTDVTSYCYMRQPITITHGGYDGSVEIPPSVMTLQVNNRDGRWCEYNPSGAWFGQLSRGIPLRVRVNEGSNSVRMTGFIASLPPKWDITGNDRYVPMTVAGVTRRLQRGTTSPRSAATRTYATTDPPDLWWSMERDEPSSSKVLSIPADSSSGNPLKLLAPGILMGTADGLGGSKPLPEFVSSGVFDNAAFNVITAPTFTTQIPDLGAPVSWSMSIAVRGTLADSTKLVTWRVLGLTLNDGQLPVLEVIYDGVSGAAGLGYEVGMTNVSSPTFLSASTNANVFDGQWHEIYVTQYASGADAMTDTFLDGILTLSIKQTTHAVAYPVGTMTGPNSYQVSVSSPSVYTSDNTGSALAMGHLRFDFPAAGSRLDALTGYVGETPSTRLARLGTEEGIPITSSVTGQAMGAQGVAPFLTLVRECATVNVGRLFDNRDPTASNDLLELVATEDIMNRAVDLTVDVAAGQLAHPFEPSSDDQYLRNDWTATRPGGSSVRRTVTSGNLMPELVGTYDDSVSVNVEKDEDLADQASWRLSL